MIPQPFTLITDRQIIKHVPLMPCALFSAEFSIVFQLSSSLPFSDRFSSFVSLHEAARKHQNKLLYDDFMEFLNTTDEYGVENAHSIIRSQTKDRDSSEMLQRKAKAIFRQIIHSKIVAANLTT